MVRQVVMRFRLPKFSSKLFHLDLGRFENVKVEWFPYIYDKLCIILSDIFSRNVFDEPKTVKVLCPQA